MVTPKPVLYRKGKRKLSGNSTPAPAVALNLTAASIDDDATMVTMQFDRAIDVSAIVVTAIRVGTGSTSQLYQGDGSPSFVDAQTLRIALVPYDSYLDPNVMLFADADNGIVAVDDGGTWAGTGGTTLPFP